MSSVRKLFWTYQEKFSQETNNISSVQMPLVATEIRAMLSTKDRRGVWGIKTYISQCNLENPFSINVKQPTLWTSLLILNSIVRKLFRNQFRILMDHGRNPQIHMVEYGIIFSSDKSIPLKGICIPSSPFHYWSILFQFSYALAIVRRT